MPLRDGVDATRVVLRPLAPVTSGSAEIAADGRPPTVLDALLAAPSLAGMSVDQIAERSSAGQIVDVEGAPVDLGAPVFRPVPVYLYRDLPDEPHIPFDIEIRYRDDDLVVVDKPHFLATMPRGRHVTQTALVRLRRRLGNDDLAPAHRLDRLTAGVLLFTARPAVRSAYQELFANRLARKEYRAVAPVDERLRETVRVADRIEKTAGDLRARVVAGPVNAVSDVTLETVRDDGLGVYRLVPHTGRTHQLRLHMAGLGVPIVGDPLYPEVDAELAAAPDRGDFSTPLRLTAARLEFDDPLTGHPRTFTSRRD